MTAPHQPFNAFRCVCWKSQTSSMAWEALPIPTTRTACQIIAPPSPVVHELCPHLSLWGLYSSNPLPVLLECSLIIGMFFPGSHLGFELKFPPKMTSDHLNKSSLPGTFSFFSFSLLRGRRREGRGKVWVCFLGRQSTPRHFLISSL